MTEPEQVTVTLTLSPLTAERLKAFTGTQFGPGTIESVIYELIDHAQQAVYRSGAWEREWICQALGYDWLDNLEPDPGNEGIGWQRPKGTPG